MRCPLSIGISIAALGACTLTTSLDGLSGPPAPRDDGGTDSGPLDARSEAPNPGDGGSAYRALVVSDGPVAYYRLGDTGGRAKDEVGGHDGTYIGTLSHGPGAIAGDPDQALVATGAGWIDIAQIFAFTGNASYSIEAWIAPKPSGTLTGVFSRNVAPAGSTPSDGYSLYIETPSLAPTMGRWLSSNEQAVTGPGLSPVGFTHVVGTYDGSTLRVYRDGILASSNAATQAIIAPATDLAVGATRNGTYGYFVGSLDEVALYDKVLPSDRIAAHHAVGRGK